MSHEHAGIRATTNAASDVCGGSVEIWDQTVGCPECGEELWSYPGRDELGLTVAQYEERFWRRHPFSFLEAHDDGDESPDAWDQEEPVGGWQAWVDRRDFGNAAERHDGRRERLEINSDERGNRTP